MRTCVHLRKSEIFIVSKRKMWKFDARIFQCVNILSVPLGNLKMEKKALNIFFSRLTSFFCFVKYQMQRIKMNFNSFLLLLTFGALMFFILVP